MDLSLNARLVISAISSYISDISDEDWKSLKRSGLNILKYFIIAYDRPYQLLGDITIDELAELTVADWSELSGLYPLLQGHSDTLVQRVLYQPSEYVQIAQKTSVKRRYGSFMPEFEGEIKPYTLKVTIRPTRTHGPVVNALYAILSSKGYRTTSDQYRDFAILRRDGQMSVLFEVKTDLSNSSIYGGIGQLMLHGADQDVPPGRVLVIPGTPNKRTSEALRRLKIQILKYGIVHEKPVFDDLETILPS